MIDLDLMLFVTLMLAIMIFNVSIGGKILFVFNILFVIMSYVYLFYVYKQYYRKSMKNRNIIMKENVYEIENEI